MAGDAGSNSLSAWVYALVLALSLVLHATVSFPCAVHDPGRPPSTPVGPQAGSEQAAGLESTPMPGPSHTPAHVPGVRHQARVLAHGLTLSRQMLAAAPDVFSAPAAHALRNSVLLAGAGSTPSLPLPGTQILRC
ncbi:hypothetical protein [Nonomuraea sp. NPDC049784]|uniref:hypothetical protein n=1 Tax=Nonomuraea sp. NPDC049784 TaxID=3154361 RepID=UPI0033C95FFC